MKDEDAAAGLTFLRESLPTDGLDEPRLLALAAAARAERFPAGETILHQGGEPGIYLYVIRSGQVDLVVNTPRGRGPRADGAQIRTTANVQKVPCLTTVAAALAAAAGIADWAEHGLSVRSLQEYHGDDQLRLPV